jgi:four helix bundle protein
MMPYERFDAWKVCHELALSVYRATEAFPKSELYGLTSQLRRAAFSAAANIAEGAAKRGSAEFRRYLDISLGSLSELAYGARLAAELQMLTPEVAQNLQVGVERAGKVTMGLYKAVANRRAR